MALLDFLQSPEVGRVVSALGKIGEMNRQRVEEEHMSKVMAANPQFGQQLYNAKSSLAKLNDLKGPQYQKIGNALIRLDPNTGSFEEIYKGESTMPSSIQIANEMQEQLKIIRDPNATQGERDAALERYNLIGQAAKTYGFERGVEFGMDGLGAPNVPPPRS